MYDTHLREVFCDARKAAKSISGGYFDRDFAGKAHDAPSDPLVGW